jgi:His-Xaa-Ser system protein HxsD
MTTPLADFPAGTAEVDAAAGSVRVTVDESVYPLEALYGAGYVFIDRCFLLIDRPDAQRFRVTLSPKAQGADEAALRALAGELLNELLSCAWRHKIAADNRATIEAVTMQALAGAMGPPSLDDLKDFDFSEEPFEDPLGIAMSWEEKYKKKGEEKK